MAPITLTIKGMSGRVGDGPGPPPGGYKLTIDDRETTYRLYALAYEVIKNKKLIEVIREARDDDEYDVGEYGRLRLTIMKEGNPIVIGKPIRNPHDDSSWVAGSLNPVSDFLEDGDEIVAFFVMKEPHRWDREPSRSDLISFMHSANRVPWLPSDQEKEQMRILKEKRRQERAEKARIEAEQGQKPESPQLFWELASTPEVVAAEPRVSDGYFHQGFNKISNAAKMAGTTMYNHPIPTATGAAALTAAGMGYALSGESSGGGKRKKSKKKSKRKTKRRSKKRRHIKRRKSKRRTKKYLKKY